MIREDIMSTITINKLKEIIKVFKFNEQTKREFKIEQTKREFKIKNAKEVSEATLHMIISQQQTTMRQRVENEWKLLTTFFIFIPALLTLFFKIVKIFKNESTTIIVICIASIIITSLFMYFIIKKIIAESKIYDVSHASVKSAYILLKLYEPEITCKITYPNEDNCTNKNKPKPETKTLSVLTKDYLISKSGKGYLKTIYIILSIGLLAILVFALFLYKPDIIKEINSAHAVESTSSGSNLPPHK